MTVEKHAGRQQIVCECGMSQPQTYAADDFAIMVVDAKADGWIIAKSAGEWTHTCPDCASSAGRGRRGSLL
jgi:hypothetical protein